MIAFSQGRRGSVGEGERAQGINLLDDRLIVALLTLDDE